MKTYRRIEITAFRRRVTIVSGKPAGENTDEQTNTDVLLNNAERQEIIEMKSEKAQQILLEAVRLLEEKLVNKNFQDLSKVDEEIDLPSF